MRREDDSDLDGDSDLDERDVVRGKKRKKLLVPLLIAVGLLGLCTFGLVVGAVGYIAGKSKVPAVNGETNIEVKPVAVAAEDKPAITIHVNTLFNDYRDNTIGADAKYKGKFVELSGEVQEMSVDAKGRNYIGFKTVESISEVYPPNIICFVKQDAQAAFGKLKEGNKIKVIARVVGRSPASIQLGFIVTLDEARLVK